MKVKNRNEPKVGTKKPRRTRSERFGERKKTNTIGFVRYDSHTMGCQLTISSLISGAAFNHSLAAITTCVSRRRWRPRRFLRPKSRSTVRHCPGAIVDAVLSDVNTRTGHELGIPMRGGSRSNRTRRRWRGWWWRGWRRWSSGRSRERGQKKSREFWERI